MRHSTFFRIVGLLAAAVLFTSVQAQEDPAKSYPNKVIRVIVGYAAGGANDLVARVFGARLAEGLGQPVIVENKTGAAGMIDVEYVTKARPDQTATRCSLPLARCLRATR